MLRFGVLVLLIASVVGGGVYYRHRVEARADQHRFRTERIERGDLQITVDATGTIEPEEVVDVPEQVTDRIAEQAKDPRRENDTAFREKSRQYRSPVKKGMLL